MCAASAVSTDPPWHRTAEADLDRPRAITELVGKGKLTFNWDAAGLAATPNGDYGQTNAFPASTNSNGSRTKSATLSGTSASRSLAPSHP